MFTNTLTIEFLCKCLSEAMSTPETKVTVTAIKKEKNNEETV